MAAKTKRTDRIAKTVLITGVTGAVGSAVALEIANSGAQTILLARNEQKLEVIKKDIVEKSGNKKIETFTTDFSNIASVKKAAREITKKYKSLDTLLNVAAVFKSKREISKDGLEMMFAVNHIAPFILTNALLEAVKKSKDGRIITVTAPSTTKLDFDDLQAEKNFFALKAFGASKMANLLFTYALASRLEGSNSSAMAYFPGLVKSGLMKDMPAILRGIIHFISNPAEKAAGMLARLSLDPEYQNANGKFYKYTGKELKSSDYSYDKNVYEKLWEISEKY